MDEKEEMTLEQALAQVIGTESKRIINPDNGEMNYKAMEGLAKVVDALTTAKESEANSELEYEKLRIEQSKIDLEYDRMSHEKEIEGTRAMSDRLKTAGTVAGILIGAALGVYAGETQKDLAKTQMEFELAELDEITKFEQDGIYTSQASRQVLGKLGKKTLPNLIGKLLSFKFF